MMPLRFLILLIGIGFSQAAKEKSGETAKPDAKKKAREGGFRLPSSFENIKSKILTCMTKPADVPPFINGKAPFAIVQAVRGERTLPEDFDRASSMVRCYTRKHGGLHFQNVFNNDYHTEMNFYSARWKTLRDRFWGVADWLIGADGDIAPIGWHKNLMNWFNNISEDVVIHIRESNYELAAAMVAFRTSSPFARCFLNEWIHLGKTTGQINSDNGDLLQLVMGVANQTLMEQCVQKRLPGNTYSTHFVPCFSQFYDLYETNKRNFLGQSYAKGGLPIKIYYPMQGFLRSFEGPHEAHTQYGQCLSTDVFGHGYKKIGHMFFNNDLYSCTNQAIAMNSFLPACQEKTHFQNDTETLELAKKECYWHYPGCLRNGKNDCKEMKHCKERILLNKENRWG